MPKVTAIIHLRQHSAYAPCRVGQFLRPDKQTLHMWLGKELSIAEFNTEWPKACKSVTETVHVKLIEHADDEASESITKEAHEAKLTAIQEGVNEFTAQCNAQLAAKDAQIAGLETKVLEFGKTTSPVEDSPAEDAAPVIEPDKVPVVEVVESASAGDSAASEPSSSPAGDDPAPSTAQTAKAAKKATKAAAKEAAKAKTE